MQQAPTGRYEYVLKFISLLWKEKQQQDFTTYKYLCVPVYESICPYFHYEWHYWSKECMERFCLIIIAFPHSFIWIFAFILILFSFLIS